MQKTLTLKLNSSQSNECFEYLKAIGGEVRSNANEYVKWDVKGFDWTAMMYTSGKFVLQSSDIELEQEMEKKFSNNSDFVPHIGSDEVGKGDYFGPLVVCACFIDDESLKKVVNIGVMDSKKLTDGKMLEMGEVLVKDVEYEVKIISPREYADLNQEYGNVAIILAKAHVEAIERLFKRTDNVNFVVVDQFSKTKSRLSREFNLDVPLKQYHRAESDVAVAVASILARYFFLLEFEKMNRDYNMRFPLGATHVIKFARKFFKKYGMDGLRDVAKVSFKTTKKVVSSSF